MLLSNNYNCLHVSLLCPATILQHKPCITLSTHSFKHVEKKILSNTLFSSIIYIYVRDWLMDGTVERQVSLPQVGLYNVKVLTSGILYLSVAQGPRSGLLSVRSDCR